MAARDGLSPRSWGRGILKATVPLRPHPPLLGTELGSATLLGRTGLGAAGHIWTQGDKVSGLGGVGTHPGDTDVVHLLSTSVFQAPATSVWITLPRCKLIKNKEASAGRGPQGARAGSIRVVMSAHEL